MEVFGIFVILYLGFIYVAIRAAMDNKKKKQQYREYLKKSFGNFSDAEMKAEDLENRAKSYHNAKDKEINTGYYVDDITWNDLSMDSIFAQMNYTKSTSGEEYLYKMLREPVIKAENDSFMDMNRHIEYFMENETERVDVMEQLHYLSRTGKYSLTDYMNYLDNMGTRSNLKHYLGLSFIVASIGLVFVSTNWGVALLIGAICFNIATYFKEKGTVSPYVSTFAYIMRLVNNTDSILKINFACKTNTDDKYGINDYLVELNKNREALKGIENNSKIVLKMGASSGGLEDIVWDYIKMITHIDLIKFNNMYKQVQERKKEIFALSESIGYIDAIISIGHYRAALPEYCIPELCTGAGSDFEIENGYHPKLSKPVSNSFCQNNGQGMLITGSNASGKSTFLKMVAINSILAQTIFTCSAKKYKANYYRIYSSMALRDDLTNGESYYIVEIKALKRILDAVPESDTPLLCFVDEVLRGTNTVERIAASTQILKRLALEGVCCFAATHDIELTHLLEDNYSNYHFEEEVKDGDILFSYRLMNGRAHTRNAIKLLEIIGFSKNIISEADAMAADFLNTGEWKK